MRRRAHHAPRRRIPPGDLPAPAGLLPGRPGLPHMPKQFVLHGISDTIDLETLRSKGIAGPFPRGAPLPVQSEKPPHRSLSSQKTPKRSFFTSTAGRFAPRLSSGRPAYSRAARRAHGTANARGILYAPDGRAAEVVSPAARPDTPMEKEVLCPPSTAPL